MNKNKKLLDDFIKYCEAHPEQRFWQALRNWARVAFVSVSKDGNFYEDTFYWEDKTK